MKSPSVKKRRGFLAVLTRGGIAAALAGIFGAAAVRTKNTNTVWQIDPAKCTQCGLCATSCVLSLSAVKCVHRYAMCGYCNLCFGFFRPDANALTSAAENQVCPTGAIKRTFVEDPYFEYTINEPLCIGCSKCVKGCTAFGNGSLYLQIRHDRCVQCNSCAIARVCPSGAISRIPSDKPYIIKGEERKS
ncbi:MAG: 4Fe-4S binding protein [Spirochaetes bacterium]|nr:4Fe-4S binding protein [Spirochaetota bacterium]